jgi:hypothetical protein
MDLLMRRKPGKWTFPYQNAAALDELGLKVKSFSSVDVPVEREAMIKSFKDAFGGDYDEIIKKVDLDICEYSIKIAKERKIFEVRRHSLDDIEKYAAAGYLAMVCIDLNILNGKEGVFLGHFVIIVGIDKENVWINEPNQGANIRYPRILFENAYTAPEIDDDILVVFGKK